MPTRAEVTAYAKAQNAIVASAKRDLDTIWLLMRDSVWDVEKVRRMAANIYPSLVMQYGNAAAALAAEWFEGQIGERAVVAATVTSETATVAAYGAVRPGDPVKTLAVMGAITDRLVKQAGRDTVRLSSHRADVRWARVPSGAKTCGFCMVLASRGAVYRSEDTADGGRYHDDCDCVATPIRDLSEYPKGYDPDELYMKYAAAQSAAGSSNMSSVLHELRQQQGIS